MSPTARVIAVELTGQSIAGKPIVVVTAVPADEAPFETTVQQWDPPIEVGQIVGIVKSGSSWELVAL